MSDGVGTGGVLKRLAVLVVTAAVVVGFAAGGAVVAEQRDGDSSADDLDTAEFQPENVAVERIDATGAVEPDRSVTTGSGTVVIDNSHGNRYDRATIEPLVRGLTRVGYTVEVHENGDLAAALEDAKALVVIDPSSEFASGDVDDVRQFTGQGGRLLVVGEPDRIGISASLFGTSIQTQESSLTTLGAAYGTSFGTAYLLNQQSADANYKWITTTATDAEGLGEIERTTMYTAASVRTRGGEVLLRASPQTKPSNSDDVSGSPPVATRRNDVVFVGDKTFMRGDRYRVADNEEFLTYLVEFLASGDRDTSRSLDAGGGGETSTDSANVDDPD